MVIFVFAIAILCLYKIDFIYSKKSRALHPTGIYSDYLSIEKTNSIKGIFVLLIVLSHAKSYLSLQNNILNSPYSLFSDILGQGVVVMFLFYSGYAMMLSCSKKGQQYVHSIPVKRVLKVLFNFDVAVFLFFILQTALGSKYTVGEIILAFTSLGSFGNSNWYIFAIIVLYMITYFAFMIGKNNKKLVLSCAFILTVVYIIVMHRFKESYWYDTALLYPMGMLWYSIREKAEKLLTKNVFIYPAVLLLMLALFVVTHHFTYHITMSIIYYIIMGIIILMLTMKVQINNRILQFLGKNLFAIYILQRIPMIIFDKIGLNENPYIFVILSFAATLIIAVPFNMLITKLDSIIFKKTK